MIFKMTILFDSRSNVKINIDARFKLVFFVTALLTKLYFPKCSMTCVKLVTNEVSSLLTCYF